jgi:ribose transport system ATP-binding protein
MAEVVALSNRVTVLRDGQVECTVATVDVTADDLVGAMVGSKLAALRARPQPSAGEPAVSFRAVTGGPVRDLDLDVAFGEIVGLAGVDGSGRSEATYLLGGAVPWESGQVELDGVVHTRLVGHRTRAMGIVFVGSDRRRESAVPTMTARENVTLGGLDDCGRSWWVSRRLERRAATAWMRRLTVNPPLPERTFGQFSGGNQQKIVLARALRSHPKLLVVDQPVHGVDVGAKAAIFEQLSLAAASGVSIVVASSDAEDLVAICSRVLVMERGRVANRLVGDAITVDAIERSTLGQHATASSAGQGERVQGG